MPKKKPCSEAQRCRDMMDAIREMLGHSPLYGPDGIDSCVSGNRYVSSQMIGSIGTGNRTVVSGDSFPNN